MSAPWGKYLVGAAVLPIVLTLAWNNYEASGQQSKDDKKPAAAKEDAKEPKKEAKEKKMPKGQLPQYYAKVVTDAQKEKIYTIQAKFKPQLDALEDQLKAMKERRDTEVEGVLDAEQLAKVKAAKDEAAAAAAAKKKAGDKPAEKTAEVKPVVKTTEAKPAK